MIFNKDSFGKKRFKYFIGYKDYEKVKPLGILPSKISGYTKTFDETKYKPFIIKYNIF